MTGVRFEPVVGELPADFEGIRNEARAEGFGHMDRLARDWELGDARFDREGEVLLAARARGVLAGVGGLTIEPALPGALRMRRFYVRPAFRRRGIGRTLVQILLDRARGTHRLVTVNAMTADGPAFWEALGFTADASDGHTHVLRK